MWHAGNPEVLRFTEMTRSQKEKRKLGEERENQSLPKKDKASDL